MIFAQIKVEKAIFKYTGKMVRFSTNMGSLVCRSEDDLDKLIDGIYMLFYENLEHIKALDSDNAVRNEDVYQCMKKRKNSLLSFYAKSNGEIFKQIPNNHPQ